MNQDKIKKLQEHLASSAANHSRMIMLEETLHSAHVYCIMNNVSPQQYGPLLEKYIRVKFNYVKNDSKDAIGDCSKDGKNSEVKVSLGGSAHTKFNFVQIRPAHDCETYILTAYHLCAENVELGGDLYIFRVPKEGMNGLILRYGNYAHGTLKEYGPISGESLSDGREYCLRPTFNDDCWKELLNYTVQESEL